MRYSPFASVVTERTFSISAGLRLPRSRRAAPRRSRPSPHPQTRSVRARSREARGIPTPRRTTCQYDFSSCPILLSRQVRQRFSSAWRIWRILVGIHREIAIVDDLSRLSNSGNWIGSGDAQRLSLLIQLDAVGGIAQRRLTCPAAVASVEPDRAARTASSNRPGRRVRRGERVNRGDILVTCARRRHARRAGRPRRRPAATDPTAVARIQARPASAWTLSAAERERLANCATASAGATADRQQLPEVGVRLDVVRPQRRRAPVVLERRVRLRRRPAAARRGCCAPARSRDRSAAPPRNAAIASSRRPRADSAKPRL